MQITFMGPAGGYRERAEVFEGALPAAVAFVTLWRTAGRRRQLVRGAVRRSVSGVFSVIDTEIESGRLVQYQLQHFNAAGTDLGFGTSATITTPEFFAVHNVFEPSQALEYKPVEGAFSSIGREAPASLFTPEGEARPRFIGGRMSGVAGLRLDCATDGFAEADVLHAMFGTDDDAKVPILVIRTPPRFRGPGTLIAAVTQPEEVLLTNHVEGQVQHWSLVGTEVEPPAPGLAEPVLEWDDVAAAYATWDAIAAAYPTWSALEQDYGLATR